MATLHFDVLVVGAGSAGSVVAARLSEDPARRVGLIEAGEMPSDPDIADPLKWPQLPGRPYDWAYRTAPQPFTAGRIHEWPRGRIVGGSSCLHAMAHVRGHPDDFDAWAEAGGPRWSYRGLLPGFRRSESFSAGPAPGRGVDGPLAVYVPDDEVSPVVRAYMAAGNALGVPAIGDHNSDEIIGTAPNSLTIADGRRVSLADAYLPPAVRARPNLAVLTGAMAEQILFDGPTASGVMTTRAGRPETVHADRIVVATGAIETPLLLMRSGIGDPAVLADAAIRCRIDRRAVGANLQDHLLVLGNLYRARKPVPPSRLQHSESLMYLHSDDLGRADGAPDIVLACVVAPSVAPGLPAPAYGSAYTILCGVCHPTSRGRITPTGPTSSDAPVIDPHYLETDHDRSVFRAALKTARLVGGQPELDAWRDSELLPGPGATSDEDLDAFIAKAACTHHHPSGTCRLGRDGDAVVDPDLRLIGLDNVFIVDASVIPAIPSGPINAAVVAIAETWSAACGAS
ncbi:MAG: GMC family oxidoreductase N-terminal domain-containing protein [Bauldia sp.]|nr:GMC family oxidoreductase N-terminal domain-containing protein [Bauldia sp.]